MMRCSTIAVMSLAVASTDANGAAGRLAKEAAAFGVRRVQHDPVAKANQRLGELHGVDNAAARVG
jgi:predicted glycosyltransferase